MNVHKIAVSNFEAVIFDLDGVITDTASVHAAIWKKMFDDFLGQYAARQGKAIKLFDPDEDYRLYVDGKPRIDGVRDFLLARKIELPEGQPEDLPGTETWHGLGNLKNEYFRRWIEEQGVEAYKSTIDLIHRFKKHGLKTAVISASKNCALILEMADLAHLFDVRVDGIDSELLKIPGKPAPDIFLEAARLLSVNPAKTIVIEDALSGVQAAKAGRFGLVIGLARHGEKESLLTEGADLVVTDLSEICLVIDEGSHKALPSALDCFAEIRLKVQGKKIAVFLDYDGTLTPIVSTPDQAIMAAEMRDTVRELSHYCPVAIISGRDLKDVREKVKIDSLIYAGSHGFEIAGPKDLKIESEIGQNFLPVLDQAEDELSWKLGSIPGLLLERKKFAMAIHYRLVDPERIGIVEKVVNEVSASHPQLRKAYGKKVFELQPNVDWHKGRALLTLLHSLKLRKDEVLPFYIGDDVTDEDAFRVLKGWGIGIVVWERPYESAATYYLKNPDEVQEFLLKLISFYRRRE